MASAQEEPATLQSLIRGYLPLHRYSLIGDCHTAALVADDASIDWLCLPQFDSNPVFARIVGTDHGGFWAITEPQSATAPQALGQSYQPDTAIVETDIQLASGKLRVTDFMPLADDPAGDHGTTVVRQIRAVQGSPMFSLRLKATLNYGETVADFVVQPDRAYYADGERIFTLQWAAPAGVTVQIAIASGGTLVATTSLEHEQTLTVAFSSAPGDAIIPQLDWSVARQRTHDFWTGWVAGLTYQGDYRAAVTRSAITLKLLTSAPTGSVVAAPTTSLPESIGGVRNWDYRYAWLRDSAFTMDALTALGQASEALAWMKWLGQRERNSPYELRTIYTIRGERDLPEYIAPALAGYRASSPVRVGNGAADQTQLDIYGEWMESVAHTFVHEAMPADWLRDLVVASVDHVCQHWSEPDQGIWEIRSAPQHFVYSKVMCWVAVDRGMQIAQRFGWSVDVERWRATCDAIRQSVLSNGIDTATGAFKMSYETIAPDAANLMIALVGFLPLQDPHSIATTQYILDELRDTRGFVYRYRHLEDGVGGDEGTFVMCSFWLAENLARQGRYAEAQALFEQLLSHASPTGLMSEMIDSQSGELLGNYPQAFSHIGIIRTALALATQP